MPEFSRYPSWLVTSFWWMTALSIVPALRMYETMLDPETDPMTL